MPSNHLILCHPLLLPPSIFPSIRVFSKELVLHIRWPKYWSFSFSISPSKEYSGLIHPSGLTYLIYLQSKGLSSIFSNTTVQKHQFFGTQLSLWEPREQYEKTSELHRRKMSSCHAGSTDVGMLAYGLVLYKYQHQVWNPKYEWPMCALKVNWQTNKICKYVRFRVCLLVWGFITESIS